MAFQSLNEFYKEAMEREKKGKISGFYAVLPHFILEDKGLTATDKILYGEISSLANKFGYCYATNQHFTEILNCHYHTLNKSFKKLREKNYIEIEIEKNKDGTRRKVWITCGKVGGGLPKIGIRGLPEIGPPKEITQIDNNNLEKRTFKKEGGTKPG